MLTPRTEFAQAIKAIATERGLDADVILDAIKQAIVAAYKRDARERGEETEGFGYGVELDSTSGEAKVFAWPAPEVELDEDGEPIEGVEIEEPAPEDKEDVTPPGFGRIAAQTAKQVIHQKIKEAEKGAIMDEFSGRVGSLISGMVLRFDGPNVRVDLGRTEGIMRAEDRVPNERLSSNQRLSFLLKEIEETPRGKQLVLSRTDPQFVVKLFEREVPEIGSGSVVVDGISRDPGVRTKIAVSSGQSGVDPVGSCVGQKGVRVQSVTNELGGERVDIVPFSKDIEEYIVAALSPAENIHVTLNEKENVATVTAPEEQLSVAIGRDGQNVRLASRLTGWKIEVESDGEETEEQKEERTEEPVEESKKKDKKRVEKKDDVKKDAGDDDSVTDGSASDDSSDDQTSDSDGAEEQEEENEPEKVKENSTEELKCDIKEDKAEVEEKESKKDEEISNDSKGEETSKSEK